MSKFKLIVWLIVLCWGITASVHGQRTVQDMQLHDLERRTGNLETEKLVSDVAIQGQDLRLTRVEVRLESIFTLLEVIVAPVILLALKEVGVLISVLLKRA